MSNMTKEAKEVLYEVSFYKRGAGGFRTATFSLTEEEVQIIKGTEGLASYFERCLHYYYKLPHYYRKYFVYSIKRINNKR